MIEVKYFMLLPHFEKVNANLFTTIINKHYSAQRSYEGINHCILYTWIHEALWPNSTHAFLSEINLTKMNVAACSIQ